MPANINIDPSISLGIKQQDSMTSLSNMLNAANAAQQFKQAQQINPLEVQRQQEVLEQAKTTTKKSAFDFQQQHEAIANSAISALIASPHFQQKENGAYTDADKKAMLQDIDAVERMVKAQGVVSSAGGPADILREKINTDPASAAQFLKNVAVGQMGASEKVGLARPENVTVGGVPGLQDKFTGTVRPMKIQGEETAPRANEIVPPKELEKQLIRNKEIEAAKADLSYPVRKANQPFVPSPSEPIDLKAGQEYRQSLAAVNDPRVLVKAKRDLYEVDKKIDEIAQKAIGGDWINSREGLWGSLTRKADELINNSDYQQLSKDIANLQISELMSGGGSLQSDAGKEMVRHQTGDATYSPRVLKDIIGRITAKYTNQELQQVAANKFAKNFGDQNMKDFQRQWVENSGDGRIFQAWHINQTMGKKDPKKADAMIYELLGRPGTEEFNDNLNKLENIDSLYNNGYIPKRKK